MAKKATPAIEPGEVARDRDALLELGTRIAEAVEVWDFLPLPLGHESGVQDVGAIVFLGRSGQLPNPERRTVKAVLLVGDAITSKALRSVPLSLYENSANLTDRGDAEDTRRLPPLARAGMTAEDFSRLVARHYQAWAAKVPNPAAAIAREHEVKLATVHSWIREARLRGFIAPARNRRSSGES